MVPSGVAAGLRILVLLMLVPVAGAFAALPNNSPHTDITREAAGAGVAGGGEPGRLPPAQRPSRKELQCPGWNPLTGWQGSPWPCG